MTPAVFILVILETFALVLHSVPLLIDDSLSRHEFDDAQWRRRPTHSILAVVVSVHVVR